MSIVTVTFMHVYQILESDCPLWGLCDHRQRLGYKLCKFECLTIRYSVISPCCSIRPIQQNAMFVPVSLAQAGPTKVRHL